MTSQAHLKNKKVTIHMYYESEAITEKNRLNIMKSDDDW